METNTNQHYFSDPLVERYATKEMLTVFSSENRYLGWRRVWLALAEAQKELGLPIDAAQIKAIERAMTQPIDFKRVAEIEAEVQHDVMAHLKAFGELCPEAKPILHLGATSAFITDNADCLLLREGMRLLLTRIKELSESLADFCERYKSLRCVGYTHFQVALPTTVGRRAAFWLQDLVIDGEELLHRLERFKARGAKGTTGTQASFLKLFDGNGDKVKRLDSLVAEKLGFKAAYDLTGQVYPRKVDTQILAALAGIGESASKFATDVRLMQHMRELEEPFGKKQVGSSAMPFKRNPVMCERICSLARLLFGLYQTAPATSSVQWLERSLDDSAVRRLSLPRAFLLADALLTLYQRVVDGMQVHERVIEKNLKVQLPFLLTEMLLMEGVKSGGDRQDLHETLRTQSMQAFERVTNEGKENDLLDRLAAEEGFAELIKSMRQDEWEKRFLVGRAENQVDDFLAGPFQSFLAKLS